MNLKNDAALEEKILRLVYPGKSLDRMNHPYILQGPSHGEILSAARRFKALLTSRSLPDTPICLATEDKGVTAAVLLAALMGGPPVILPYAVTEPALAEAHKMFGFKVAVAQSGSALPKAVTAVSAEACMTQGEMADDEPAPQLDRPWVYLFTGGSTGAPKVWSKTPQNLLGEVFYLKERFDVIHGDRILSTAPPNHIYGLLYAVLLPLAANASVSNEIPAFPGEMIAMLEKSLATIFISLPVHYRALKSHPIHHHCLRIAFSSAGALDPEDDAAFFAAAGVPVTEVYGSTETGGVAFRCRAKGKGALSPFSVIEWRVSEEHLKIRSPFISKELSLDSEGYFTMPDRVEIDGMGEFRILGRSDGVVKVGGKRVDLAEVQEMLKREPGIRDAYVYSVPTMGGRENEIRAVVEGDVDPLQIRESLLKRIEPYAQPRQIKCVDRMPVTAAGKYDRERILRL